jgi:hypothetical protein
MRRSIASLVLVVLFAGCAGAENVAGPSASEIGGSHAGELRRCEYVHDGPSATDDIAFEKACHRDPALPQ